MSESEAAQEPSMEEILASIRRIISEDDEPAESPSPGVTEHDRAEAHDPQPGQHVHASFETETIAPAEEPAGEPAPAPVYELNERPAPQFNEEPEVEAASDPEPEEELMAYEGPEAAPEPVAYDPEPIHHQPAYEPPAEPTPVEAAPAAASSHTYEQPAVTTAHVADDLEDELLSPATETRLAGAISQLSQSPETRETAEASGTTVDSLVRELLRPMLREWLDTNLPPIVEEIVEREIQRVTRRR